MIIEVSGMVKDKTRWWTIDDGSKITNDAPWTMENGRSDDKLVAFLVYGRFWLPRPWSAVCTTPFNPTLYSPAHRKKTAGQHLAQSLHGYEGLSIRNPQLKI